MPSGQVATMRCHLGQSLGQLKAHFASELKLPIEVILMLFDGMYQNIRHHLLRIKCPCRLNFVGWNRLESNDLRHIIFHMQAKTRPMM